MGRASGRKFDKEILYLACILHDLGLPTVSRALPFEIQGAEAAKHFLEQHAYAREKIGIVWDGIVMHASPIGQFKQAEVALVGEGAGLTQSNQTSQKSEERCRGDRETVPQIKVPRCLREDLRRSGAQASEGRIKFLLCGTFRRYVPEFHPRNFCDRVAEAPFAD